MIIIPAFIGGDDNIFYAINLIKIKKIYKVTYSLLPTMGKSE